jgi:hypothetical protein
MGVGPDGACGGASGGGDSWAQSTAAATKASASDPGARILIMAAGWYHAEASRTAVLRCHRYGGVTA